MGSGLAASVEKTAKAAIRVGTENSDASFKISMRCSTRDKSSVIFYESQQRRAFGIQKWQPDVETGFDRRNAPYVK